MGNGNWAGKSVRPEFPITRVPRQSYKYHINLSGSLKKFIMMFKSPENKTKQKKTKTTTTETQTNKQTKKIH